MCGRFVIAASPELLADRFAVDEGQLDEHAPDYNVTPRAMVPIVRDPPRRDDRPEQRVLSLVRWGLVPSWAKDPSIGDRLINARSETVSTTSSYKTAFAKRRCIVPADAFYEWRSRNRGADAAGAGGRSTKRGPPPPYLVHRPGGAPRAVAGWWGKWRGGRGPGRAAAPGAGRGGVPVSGRRSVPPASRISCTVATASRWRSRGCGRSGATSACPIAPHPMPGGARARSSPLGPTTGWIASTSACR